VVHCVKTNFGISPQTYENSFTTPLFGLGQDLTPGPFLWIFSFILTSRLIANQPAITLTNPTGSISLDNRGITFVNDSYLAASSSDRENPIQSTINDLQTLSQKWERGLSMTSGVINLQKGFWVLMACRLHKGSAYLIPPSLHKYKLELIGGMHKAFEVLQINSVEYATHIQSSTIHKEAALWSYLLYLLPKITFPLMAMTL
jgi:hypothetical protein